MIDGVGRGRERGKEGGREEGGEMDKGGIGGEWRQIKTLQVCARQESTLTIELYIRVHTITCTCGGVPDRLNTIPC